MKHINWVSIPKEKRELDQLVACQAKTDNGIILATLFYSKMIEGWMMQSNYCSNLLNAKTETEAKLEVLGNLEFIIEKEIKGRKELLCQIKAAKNILTNDRR